MNTTTINHNDITSETVQARNSGLLKEMAFFAKMTVAMSAVILFLASAWL